jgi:hypothetical protein
MASDLTNLQAHTRSYELHRRAELHRLHRLAATARESERGAKPTSPSRRHLGNPAHKFRTTVARVGAAIAALR